MSEEEISDLANRIARRKRNIWSIYDVRMFADMLIDGDLIEIDSKGQARGQLYSVDVAGVMAKVKIYDNLRNDAQCAIMREVGGNKKPTMQYQFYDLSEYEDILKSMTHGERKAYVEQWAAENLQEYYKLLNGESNDYNKRIREGVDVYIIRCLVAKQNSVTF